MNIQQILADLNFYEPFRIAQGYRVGDLLLVSGQTAIDDSGKVVDPGNFDAQAQQVFANLDCVLQAGGASLWNIIKVTSFLTNMSHFKKVLGFRRKWFTPAYLAGSIVEVRSLYLPEAMIGIEAVAMWNRAAEWVSR